MLNARSILIFGADPILLDTRRQVLEKSGFRTAWSTHLEETERILRDGTTALLLLCHTLSAHDCERAVAIAHGINPNIIALVLDSTSGPCIDQHDVVVHHMDGPQKLVEMIRTILQ